MDAATQYRLYAADCDDMAARASSATLSDGYREIARKWRAMADSVEDLNRRQPFGHFVAPEPRSFAPAPEAESHDRHAEDAIRVARTKRRRGKRQPG